MAAPPLPRDLKTALRLIEAAPARNWTVGTLARACGLAPRTLQKRFRAFLGCSPVAFIRNLRLDQARRELLRAAPEESVTAVATRCGFVHLARFSTHYRDRHGELPSTTLRRGRMSLAGNAAFAPIVSRQTERPSIAVLPFDMAGPEARRVDGIADEIAVALWRLRWLSVAAPAAAQYHIRGTVRQDGADRLRVRAILVEARSGRYLWADCWEGRLDDLFAFEEQSASRIASAIQQSIRGSEIERAWRKERAELNAWDLTMRALSCALTFDPASEGMALELLEEAIELAPRDPLPLALASWCHGLRAGHHFTSHPDEDRNAARSLAVRAASVGAPDPLAETLLASGYTLAHDLTTAATHVERALLLDGGLAWAWGRSGWIKAYGGQSTEAIERFQIARSLAPGDPLEFLWAIGIGSAHLEAAEYEQAVSWYARAARERPTAVWNDRFAAAACALAGRKQEARVSLARFAELFPDVTIAQVRAGLPHTPLFLDRVAEGLDTAGMRP
jgi:AraC-like DNA-binding protein/tetratricopeptide (TPR) repeat protein